MGNLLDDDALRVSVALRPDAKICRQHHCQCDSVVLSDGRHELGYKFSAGRRSRYDTINDLLRRALVSARVPATVEPRGMVKEDNKRPDGKTLIPWHQGRSLAWDVTCVDTFTESHICQTSVAASAAANKAERLKREKYFSLGPNYHFVPFGVETLGS